MREGSLSIVIPTSGRGKFLWECLAGIAGIAHDSFIEEVLLVVNGDLTLFDDARFGRFLEGLEADVANKFSLIHEPVPGLLAGRHRGAIEAQGSFLAFVDDDVLLGEKWASALREICNSGTLGNRIAGGSVLADFRGTPPRWLSRMKTDLPGTKFALTELSLVEIDSQEPAEISPLLIFGLNFIIGRQTLFDLGGFHPDLTPNDLLRFRGDGETALAQRLISLHRKAFFHPDLNVQHIIGTERLTPKYLRKVWTRQGISDEFQAIKRAHSDQDSPKLSRVTLIRTFGKKTLRILRARGEGGRGKPADLLRQLCLTRGRLYLLNHFLKNAEVREWILRQEYFDYRYPAK